MRFPEILHKLRKDVNLGQSSVGKYCRVHKNQVGRWERGESVPAHSHMSQLCSLFNKTTRQLQGLDPLDEQQPVPVEEIRRELKAMIELLGKHALIEMYGIAQDRLRASVNNDEFITKKDRFSTLEGFPKGDIAT